VDKFLDAVVAVRAIEHGMDGFLKGVGRKESGTIFPSTLRVVAVQVAVEAVGVFEFLRAFTESSPRQRQSREGRRPSRRKRKLTSNIQSRKAGSNADHALP